MKIITTKLNTCYFNEKRKDGTPYKTKAGKEFKIVSIQVDEYGIQRISGFIWDATSPMLQWKQGDTVSIIVEKTFKDGKENLICKLPEKIDLLEMRIEAIEKQLEGATVEEIPEPPQRDELRPEDLPF